MSSSVGRVVRILEGLERVCPLKYADKSWDNVGLILESVVDNADPRRTILVCNDMTRSVLQEAVIKKVLMIISYHPPWFRPEKAMTLSGPLELLAMAASAGISIYSPHSALDAVVGGINDWLLKPFDVSESHAIVKCVEEEAGQGRVAVLNEPMSLLEACAIVRRHLDLKYVRKAHSARFRLAEKYIRTIAVCPGSGGSMLTPKLNADLVITGELSHHQVLALVSAGTSVILTEHSNSERLYLKTVYCDALAKELNEYSVVFSEEDCEPLSVDM